jgi:tetratricopeptide (TPR) repeat protein
MGALPGNQLHAKGEPVMSSLEPPNSHHLSAASGWLELGLPNEARCELARLTPEVRQHPEVLAVQWELYARSGAWDDALDVASQLLAADCTRAAGWINRSYALHELQRTEEAREALLAALPLFPSVGVIPYNLACYACRLGQLDEARQWLRKAMELDGRELVVVRARHDTDLKALHEELDRI